MLERDEVISDKNCRTMCLIRQHLFPKVYGNNKEDVLKVVKNIGGLLWGIVVYNSHFIELWSRFQKFQRNWLDDLLYDEKKLLEMHVLRVGLRIIVAEEAPYYFQATRGVIKRAGGPLICRHEDMRQVHKNIIYILEKYEALTFAEIKKKYWIKLSGIIPRIAFEQLCHSGIVLRVGRKGIAPLFGLVNHFFPDVDLYSVSENDAKEWVALKCLEAYGPLSTQDAAHWVGWTVNETEEVLQKLNEKEDITTVHIKEREEKQWIRSEDIGFLEELVEQDREDFTQILSYEDELMNGYSLRLPSSFGYSMRGLHRQHLPILNNNEENGPQIIGDTKLKPDSKEKMLIIKGIYLRKDYNNIDVKNRIEERLEEFASFHSAKLHRERSDPYVLY